jgi:hypothetical protein
MEPEYGKAYVRDTLRRYWKADKEVYGKVLKEHEDRLKDVLRKGR